MAARTECRLRVMMWCRVTFPYLVRTSGFHRSGVGANAVFAGSSVPISGKHVGKRFPIFG